MIEHDRFLDWVDAHIDTLAKRIGWNLTLLNEYVYATYGKRTRYSLTDSQLLELSEYLKKQSSQKITVRRIGISSWKKQSLRITNYRQ